MGTSLASVSPSSSFDSLIKFGDNEGVTSSPKQLSDGLGTDLPIFISNSTINLTGSLYGTATTASAVTATYASGSVIGSTQFKLIGGYSTIPSGSVSSSVYLSELNGKLLGTNCFVSIGYKNTNFSSSVQPVDVVCVNSLDPTGSLRFSTGDASNNAPRNLDFYYTVLYI